MQQFIVPQFIDVEDKIIGPVTVRQFIILLVGLFFMFISYKIFDFSLFIVTFFITLFVELVFAFVRVNGQPFHFFIINFFQTVKRPRLQIWYKLPVYKRSDKSKDKKGNVREISSPPIRSKNLPSRSRLSELSLVVDTGGAYQPTENEFIELS